MASIRRQIEIDASAELADRAGPLMEQALSIIKRTLEAERPRP